jgi:hypothetical protein
MNDRIEFTELGINKAMMAKNAAWQNYMTLEAEWKSQGKPDDMLLALTEAEDEWWTSEKVLGRQLLGNAYLEHGLDPTMAYNLMPRTELKKRRVLCW